MGLFQKDIARLIGVTTDTITYWEKGRTHPTKQNLDKLMNFDEFFDRLEKWEEKTEEDSRRKAITTVLRSKPSEYKDALVKSTLDRIMWYFENGKFGVLSVCKANNSKKKNFDIQLRLMSKLRKQKLHCIPHIGFWEKIGTRSLFIPQITRKKIRILAEKHKLNAYIWGEKRKWKCYITSNRSIAFKDDKPKVIDIDLDFIIYSKIICRENELTTILNNIKKYHGRPKRRTRKTLLYVQSKMKDLQRIKNDLIGCPVKSRSSSRAT